ncbi:MAG: MmcQ/YjbR family DNA-binding protein [Moraxella sp.]|nr:MmcQ/YjbR family DNA-binding protein [Moraxella sp.]
MINILNTADIAHDFIQAMYARYDVEPDYPWQKFPDYAVFRHTNGGRATVGKWFCLLMIIPAGKIGLDNDDMIAVINVKTDPVILGGLLATTGIYPAYHMNKEHWISVHLAMIDNAILWQLIDESHQLTIRAVSLQ